MRRTAFTLTLLLLASLTNPVPLRAEISAPSEASNREFVSYAPGSVLRGAPHDSGPSRQPVDLTADIGGAPPPVNVLGPASYTASATWCAPTPTQCQGWGGNARLAAVNSFRFGDEPYPVRVWRGEQYVDVTVVSFCACHGEHGYIDLSPAAFEVLAPLSRGRIDVSVEVLVDLPPHPDDERMRAEDGGPQVTTPPTDTVP